MFCRLRANHTWYCLKVIKFYQFGCVSVIRLLTKRPVSQSELRTDIQPWSSAESAIQQSNHYQEDVSYHPPSVQHSTMSEKELSSLLKQLHTTLSTHDYTKSTALLSKAKLALLQLNALVPSPQIPQHTLALARETLELGALVSIRLQDPPSFTRYFQQLQPFYDLPEHSLSREGSQKSKITGLYLLLLLSQGDYAGFHTLLESLEVVEAGGKGLEEDKFVQYPVKLEQWLMEGSYDRVWGATKNERAPSEEYGVFSEVRPYWKGAV